MHHNMSGLIVFPSHHQKSDLKIPIFRLSYQMYDFTLGLGFPVFSSSELLH
jgi:hypothetical protein